MKAFTLFSAVVLTLPGGPVSLLRQDPVPVPIKEWTVPWEKSRPRDPIAGR